MTNEARYTFRSTNRWAVSVPVPYSEQDQQWEDPYKHKPFRPVRLQIRQLTGTRMLYQLTGPIIRRDQTAGLLRCERTVTRAELAASYPAALADAVKALGELAAAIREDADYSIAVLGEVAAGDDDVA
jgi:hypothetical protein